MVHETLSEGLGETVDFDTVVDRTLALAVEVAGSTGVRVQRDGAFGEIAGENATPLALVFTELVTNAVEHGLKGGAGRAVLTSGPYARDATGGDGVRRRRRAAGGVRARRPGPASAHRSFRRSSAGSCGGR